MDAISIAIRTFFEAGGDVLFLIAAATFVMWVLLFERLWYINTEHKQDVAKALTYWESRVERTSWEAHMIRLRLISEVNVRLSANLGYIKTLISLLPLLGLLGTDNVATMPDMVGIVAAETPAAIERALPPE